MTLEPFKLVATVVACEKDDDGNIVREFEAGKMVIYASQFSETAHIIESAWKAAQEGTEQ